MQSERILSFLDCWACANNLRAAIETVPNDLHNQVIKNPFHLMEYCKFSFLSETTTWLPCSHDFKDWWLGLAGRSKMASLLCWGWSLAGMFNNVLMFLSLLESLFYCNFNLLFFFLSLLIFSKGCCNIYLH